MLVEEQIAAVIASRELFGHNIVDTGQVGGANALLDAIESDGHVVPIVGTAVVAVACLAIKLQGAFDAHGVEYVAHGSQGFNDVDAVGRYVLADDAGDETADNELHSAG